MQLGVSVQDVSRSDVFQLNTSQGRFQAASLVIATGAYLSHKLAPAHSAIVWLNNLAWR